MLAVANRRARNAEGLPAKGQSKTSPGRGRNVMRNKRKPPTTRSIIFIKVWQWEEPLHRPRPLLRIRTAATDAREISFSAGTLRRGAEAGSGAPGAPHILSRNSPRKHGTGRPTAPQMTPCGTTPHYAIAHLFVLKCLHAAPCFPSWGVRYGRFRSDRGQGLWRPNIARFSEGHVSSSAFAPCNDGQEFLRRSFPEHPGHNENF